MPIGPFTDFKALKGALLKRAEAHHKKIANPGGYAAAVARKIEPDFDKEAAQTRHDNAMERAAAQRVRGK